MAEGLPQCYHGAISKTECEEILGKKNKDGAYLLRDSETLLGVKCLCVYKQNVVYTYRVLQTRNGNYTLLTAGGNEESHFKSLEDLIKNYKRRNQGLAIQLRHAIKNKTGTLIQTGKTCQAVESSLAPQPVRGQRSLPTPTRNKLNYSDYENDPSSDYVEVLPD